MWLEEKASWLSGLLFRVPVLCQLYSQVSSLRNLPLRSCIKKCKNLLLALISQSFAIFFLSFQEHVVEHWWQETFPSSYSLLVGRSCISITLSVHGWSGLLILSLSLICFLWTWKMKFRVSMTVYPSGMVGFVIWSDFSINPTQNWLSQLKLFLYYFLRWHQHVSTDCKGLWAGAAWLSALYWWCHVPSIQLWWQH